jgi:acyl-CoA reductase-like NAD-dependent aldehyde dehydrogenase
MSSTYIGRFIENTKAKTFDVKNPANGEVIATLPSLNAASVDIAAKIAMEAFQTWKLTTVTERSKILKRMAELMELNRDDLAAIITLESGKKKSF